MTRAVAIMGGGRMGGGLAVALQAQARAVTLLVRTPRQTPVPAVTGEAGWRDTLAGAELVIVATPDGVITEVAAQLAALRAIGPAHVVLHLSGLLDRTALSPLVSSGAALGSFHPLQTVADPSGAPARLRGAYAGIEGDAAAREAAALLALELGMTPVMIPEGGKPHYHLGATFVANYAASLLSIGQRMAERAGIDPALASRIYAPLLSGAAGNLAALGPAAALTGAIRRGDLRTIGAHLSRLDGRERRLYCDLGLEALGLARQAGLAPDVSDRVAALLTADGSGATDR